MNRTGSVMLMVILLLSMIVISTTPAMAEGLVALGESAIGDDPVNFTGTIILGDGPWAHKDVLIAKWNDYSGKWEYYYPMSEATTDLDGNYETGLAGFTPDGHFGMFIKERSDYWQLGQLVDEKDLTDADFTEMGANTNRWLYNGGWNYEVPEFTTIAIPAVVLFGLFALYRRKQKK
ncbi:MAG: hypothetical protein C5S49_00005 [Candidatus Methanogaster sp.]|nr:MAG: hypothetical protein C5S49_00005 [ANME-2 cluster archaeon]